MKKYELTLKREEMVKAGAYDGRFVQQTGVNKKKKEDKFKCRKNFVLEFKNYK